MTDPSVRCERCDKIVVLTKFTLCYECRQDEKAEVDRAMLYLKNNRGASLNMVAEATGVDPQLVLRLIRGGRVEVSKSKPGQKKKR